MRERTAVYLSLRWGDVVLRTAYAETASRFVLLSVPDGPARVLGRGSRTQFDLGKLSVDVDVELAEPGPSRRLALAADGMAHHAFSLAFHVGLVATLALFAPRPRRGRRRGARGARDVSPARPRRQRPS
jgi:hypothetical protein